MMNLPTKTFNEELYGKIVITPSDVEMTWAEYKGKSLFDAGIIYAPYIPLYQTSPILEEIYEDDDRRTIDIPTLRRICGY